jgi:hypothetical protein
LPDGGLPVPPGTTVWLREPDPGRRFDFDRDVHGRSNVDPTTGAFSFANVPPGNYILRAVPPNAAPYLYAPSNIIPLRVFTSSVVLPDLALSTPTITGTIYAPGGVTPMRGIVHVFARDLDVEVERRWSEDGGFAIGGLRPGPYRLQAEPWPDDALWGSRPATATVVLSATQSVALTLSEAQVVGRATYLSGATPLPVAEALVRVGGPFGIRRFDLTNASGGYAIGGLPPGPAVIAAESPLGMGWLLPPTPQAIVVPPTGVITVPLAFTQLPKRVGGQVRTNTNLPVANALVEAHRIDQSGRNATTTNAAGVYSMTLSPGLWAVHVRPISITSPSGWVHREPARTVRFDRSPTPEDKRIGFIVDLADAIVAGAVQLPDGSAPPFTVTARLHTDEGLGISQTVNASGQFSFRVPHGVYKLDLHVASRLYAAPPLNRPVIARPITPTLLPTITLLARDANVAGLITTNAGDPVADIPVIAWNRETHAAFRSLSGPDGAYVIPVYSGTWFVRPDPLPAQPFVYTGTVTEVPLISGATVSDINFALAIADATIHGTLVDSDGNLLSDARGWASAVSSDRSTRNGAPVQNGEFDILVPSGTYSVHVRLPSGYEFLFDGVPVVATVATSATTHVTITLQKKTATFYGALLDKRTNLSPINVDGRVWAHDDAAWVGTDIRNSGLYELPVAPGLWRLNYAVEPGSDYVKTSGPRSYGVGANQKQLANLPVVRKDGVLSGTVVLTDGVTPAVGAIVIAEGVSADIEDVTLRTPVRPDGRFVLQLPHGKYNVRSAMPSGERLINPRVKDVVIPPGGSATVALQYRQPDALLVGSVSLAGAPAISGTVGIWAYSSDDAYNATKVRAGGAYTLPLVSGQTYTVVAVLETRESFWVTRTTTLVSGTTSLDLALAGPKPKPAPITTMFDAATDKEIVIADGTRIFIPAGALPVAGNVIVHITPLAGVPHHRRGDVLGLAYAFEAYTEDGTPITAFFNTDVAITFQYDPIELARRGININHVKPVYFSTTTNSWARPDSYVVDETRREITLQIDHFTDYSLVTEQPAAVAVSGVQVFLPMLMK